MPKYKASVKEKDTGKWLTVSSVYDSKADFIKDLRRNGYAVNPDKVKTEAEYNRIINTTNGNKWDWSKKYTKPRKKRS